MAPNEVTVRKAAEILGLTPRMIHYLIEAGTFPGWHKADAEVETSTILLPLAEVMAEKKRRESERSD